MFGGYMFAGAPFAGAGNLSGQLFTKSLSETVTSTDSISKLIAYFKTLSETLNSSDSKSLVSTYKRTLTDTLTSSDVFSRTWTIYRTFSETISDGDVVLGVDYIPNKRMRFGVQPEELLRIYVAADATQKSGAKIDNTGYLRIALKK